MALEFSSNKKKLIVIASGIALLLLFSTNFYLPTLKQIFELQNQYKTAKMNNEKTRESVKAISSLPNVEGRVREMDAFYQKYLPKDKSLAQLITLLSYAAEKFKISVAAINPEPSRKESLNVTEADVSVEYYALPISISIKTTQEALSEFLNWMKTQDMLLSIESLEITPALDEPGKLSARIEVVSYSLSDIPAIPQELLTYITLRNNEVNKILKVPEILNAESFSGDEFGIFKVQVQEVLPKKEELPEKMNLTGIIYSDQKKVAVINGQLCREGDIINGKTVITISQKQVVLGDNQKKYILELGGK